MDNRRPCCIRLDADDRFEEDFRLAPFWKLPHNKNGFNRMVGSVDGRGTVYWKGERLLSLDEMPGALKQGCKTAFLTRRQTDPPDHHCWVREPLMFAGGIGIVNAWVTVDTEPEPDDLIPEVFEEPDEGAVGLAIQGTIGGSSSDHE